MPLTKSGDEIIVEIDLADMEFEVEYWQNIMVCYVLCAHPPFNVTNGYIQRLWGKYDINKVVILKNRVILVRFDSNVGKNDVIEGGIITLTISHLLLKHGQ